MRRLLFTLACLAAVACGSTAPSSCPTGSTLGTTCTECGPTDACLKSETKCLPDCPDGGCATGGLCLDGLCRSVCG